MHVVATPNWMKDLAKFSRQGFPTGAKWRAVMSDGMVGDECTFFTRWRDEKFRRYRISVRGVKITKKKYRKENAGNLRILSAKRSARAWAWMRNFAHLISHRALRLLYFFFFFFSRWLYIAQHFFFFAKSL